ncbi:GIM4 [[Candida] subhashii]|uniref:GIM4 n=1 Tax=[Candida] subhashii TaxID=561895 RepID=A0A8J5QPS0_9ASCO|nr:GIM4 [[Candida] subhashii]KAG7665319.1 GIM4 [[Candida] subhashii]
MSTTAADEQKSQALQQEYNRFKELISELESQLSSVTAQLQEHGIVDNTLSSIEPEKRTGRKCFKMIGGVLVEKSVDEVINILTEEINTLKDQRSKLDEQLTKNRKELESWMKKHNVKVVQGNQ